MHLHLVVSRLNGYYAGLLAPGSFSDICFCFFSFSDRTNQNQKVHSTINENKGIAKGEKKAFLRDIRKEIDKLDYNLGDKEELIV